MFAEANYRRAIVSYVDILGFKDLVFATRSDPSNVKWILELLKSAKSDFSGRHVDVADMMNFLVAAQDNRSVEDTFASFNFSDLVVRCTWWEQDALIHEIADHEFAYLTNKQFEIAAKGVFFRGAISLGEIIAESGMIFGPGLIRAYALESEQAVYPRIIVDHVLLEELCTTRFPAWKHPCLERGEDGIYFLDYVCHGFLYLHHVQQRDHARDLAVNQREAIKEALAKARDENKEKVMRKFLWLGLYHNGAVRRLVESLKNDHAIVSHLESCLIDERLLYS